MQFLIDITLKSIFISVIGILLLFIFNRQSARMRHWLISLTLFSLLCLPLAKWLMPTLEVVPLPENISLALTPTEESQVEVTPLPSSQTLESATIINSTPSVSESKSIFTLSLSLIVSGIVWIWGLVSVLLFIKLMLGLIHTFQLTYKAEPIKNHSAFKAFEAPNLIIKASDNIHSPVTWGIFTSVILIPKDILHLPAENLATIMKHELAHIHRRDYLTHLVGLLSGILYWVNPFVWYLKKQHIIEREKACDEMVISNGIQPTLYAEHLVAITRQLTQKGQRNYVAALPFSKFSQMKQRVLAILSFDTQISLPTRRELIKYGFGFACFVPLIAAISPISPLEELPVIENFVRQLELEPALISENSIPQIEPKVQEKEVVAVVKENVGNISPLPSIQQETITPLSLEKEKIDVQLPTIHKETSIKSLPQGIYHNWKKGSSQFTMWTYGAVYPDTKAPYIRFGSADGMIIIEEKKGAKTFTLMLSPAPFDGGLVHEFYGDSPNTFSGFAEGSIVPFWFKNGKWVLLSRGSENWIKKHMPNVSEQLKTLPLQESTPTNPIWQTEIDQFIALKNDRFLSYEVINVKRGFQLIDTDKKWEKRLEDVPFLQADKNLAPAKRNPRRIGRLSPTKTTTGFSTGEYSGDRRFGTFINFNGPVAQVKDFNFHIGNNLSEGIKFGLNFYKVKNNELIGRINADPILFEIGTEEGWIKHTLDKSLAIDSDVLATLDVLEITPDKQKQQGLFLSLSFSLYRSFEKRVPNEKWNFWDGNFSFYLTVE